MPVAIDEYYVVDLLDEQMARNDTLFSTRGVEIKMECDPDLVWYFDQDLVASVINDALVNCSRYTNDKVLLSAAVEGDKLVIKVSDNGRGYPGSMLGAQDAEAEPSVYDNGRTNLGLYFAARVAQMHTRDQECGSLALANGGQLGGGEFILTLP